MRNTQAAERGVKVGRLIDEILCRRRWQTTLLQYSRDLGLQKKECLEGKYMFFGGHQLGTIGEAEGGWESYCLAQLEELVG